MNFISLHRCVISSIYLCIGNADCPLSWYSKFVVFSGPRFTGFVIHVYSYQWFVPKFRLTIQLEKEIFHCTHDYEKTDFHILGKTMSEVCPCCETVVYSAEKAAISGKKGDVYHKRCLKCCECNKRLDSMTYNEHEGKVFFVANPS